MRPLVYTPAFVRDVRRMAKGNAVAAAGIAQALTRLEADAFDPRLRAHRLSGRLAGSWACSAGYDLRIIFEIDTRQGAESILLTACGTHDEVY